MAFDRIAVVGAGAWGIALANVIARAGRTVLLAAREGADVLAKTRESPRLPGVQLDARIAVAPVGTELSGYDAILLAVPSQNTRAAACTIAATLRQGPPAIACATACERSTHRSMTEVLANTAPSAIPAMPSC